MNHIHSDTTALQRETLRPTKSGRPLISMPKKVTEGIPDSTASEVAVTDTPPPSEKMEAGAETHLDKFASCDLDPALDKPVAPVSINKNALDADTHELTTTNLATVKTELEIAIGQCVALGDKLDSMVNEKWGKRSAPILSESLNFLAAYLAATKEEQEASRKTLKAKSGVSREPNVENLPVIAVYMCVSCSGKTRTKAQRKEWCRFATVVKVAARMSVKPEEAAGWLEKKTLNEILAEQRAHKKAEGNIVRKPTVPKMLKDYKHIASALAVGSKFEAMAKTELLKADAAIASAMAEAASSAPFPTKVASTADLLASDAQPLQEVL